MAKTDTRNLRQASIDIRRMGRTPMDVPSLLERAASDIDEANATIVVLRSELFKANFGKGHEQPPPAAHAATDEGAADREQPQGEHLP